MKDQIQEVQTLAAKYEEFFNGDDSLYDEINGLSEDQLARLINELRPDVNRIKPINFLRYVILKKIESNEQIDSSVLQETKSLLAEKQLDSFNFLSNEEKAAFQQYPDKTKSFYSNWSKPASILFPLFYDNTTKARVKEILGQITDNLIEQLELSNVKIHIVEFLGPQNYGGAVVWGAIHPDNINDHRSAYQLFFRIKADGLQGGLYSGSKIKTQKVDESQQLDSVKELVEFHRSKLKKWNDLNANITKPPSAMEIPEQYVSIPLNQIFFGPPGTGKTYHTVEEAIRIVEELTIQEVKEKYPDRASLKRAFQAYVEEHEPHIGFTTFHQSYSYEDFIEGIKPIMEDEIHEDEVLGYGLDANQLEYEIAPGIFITMAEHADSWDVLEPAEVREPAFPISESELTNSVFYKMSLGNSNISEDDDIYNYCIENDLIALGWGESIDLTNLNTEQEIKEALKEDGQRISAGRFAARFKLKLKVGDYVFVSNGNTRLRAVAKITSNYHFSEELPIQYNHFRAVEWIWTNGDIGVKEFFKKVFSQMTIYRLKNEWLKREFFNPKKNTPDETELKKEIRRNHVLIIDEINRGNISQIFGELITLIEEDKRRGKSETLTVRLPYSKKLFTVPPNLYIIGTMNTSDRSIESLDTALRRRFTFRSMLPNSELIRSENLVYTLWHIHKDRKWNEEPYKTRAEKLYDLLGLNISLEEEIRIWEELANGCEIDDVIGAFSDYEFIGLDLRAMLNAINHRIEKLIDRDHTIGHSYFLTILDRDLPFEELKGVFENKVLPLLQEYFFGDFGKIGLVIGPGFVYEQKLENFTFAKGAEYDSGLQTDLMERSVYSFTSAKDWTVETFKQIYE